MSYATIDDLRSQLGSHRSPASDKRYADKMLHPIPDAPVVDRVAFILEYCKGKRVLEFGASGSLHLKIREAASQYWGVDREHGQGGWELSHVVGFDLDDIAQSGLPSGHFTIDDEIHPTALDELVAPQIIICGEVLEHLSNPGWFLTRLHRQYSTVPTIFTVPNCFSAQAKHHMAKGIENVNVDHVAWYSFRTIKTLLERYGYSGYRFAWYGGAPLTAEGMVIYCE